MDSANVLQELIVSACPSIRYRLHTEHLTCSPSDPEIDLLQDQILQDPQVQEVLGWQQPDGWLAWNFHGTKSIETGIRLLCEKGLSPSHPVLLNALQALERDTGRLERGIGKVGLVLDDYGLGGAEMIRASLFARAGIEDRPFVGDQIERALDGFKAVLSTPSIDDLSEGHRGKRVFRSLRPWPGIYHLRILAWTSHWRTRRNLDLLCESLARLVALSPLPPIYARYRSQIIAPPSFGMHDFTPDLDALDDAGWMVWFHRLELLARLGVVHRVPALQAQVDRLLALLEADGGRFSKRLQHPSFVRWGAYTGLMLERDWKSPRRRINDLTFRSLLILHYARAL